MILGVDPGLTGAMALLSMDGELLRVWDMPANARAKGKGNELNGYILSDLVVEVREIATGHKLEACIEHVGPMPRDSRPAAFKFGETTSVIRGVLQAHYIPVRMVTPPKWKGFHALRGKNKDASRTLAMEKWPAMRDLFLRKKDDGRAEAALIGDFARSFAGWKQE
jgi:crossover junction endodeoxyribonuclease RuvC